MTADVTNNIDNLLSLDLNMLFALEILKLSASPEKPFVQGQSDPHSVFFWQSFSRAVSSSS
jgi:hypothetical protein